MHKATLARLTAMRREDRAVVRALDVETGEERLIDPAEDFSALGRAAAAAIAADASQTVTVEGREWFLTVYNAPWELVIVGGVHIAQALAALAMPLGYRVRVIDPRAAYATEDRFAGIRLDQSWPDEALAARPLTAKSALIALAHDSKLDDPALVAALRSPAPYIGALGSTRTHAKRLARLEALGFSAIELVRIHGPVGLAIGARTPGEIALAILAQMVQCRRVPAEKSGPQIGGVVLAAGLSSRMGRNKLLTEVGGKPLLRHAVEAALASQLSPVLVVTGHQAEIANTILAGLDVTLVHNPDYAHGLSTSLKAGIAALPGACDGALVLLGDMPGITPALIDRTIAGFDPAAGRAICVATTARGMRGHPILWGRQFFAEIESLTGDAGAKSLLAVHADQVHEIKTADETPLADIDTAEALESYSRKLAEMPG